MNTPRRATRRILVVAGAVTLAVIALLVVPGLAGAGDGGDASNVPEPAPAAIEPSLPYDPNYWTPERMANAKPMPMPTVP